MTRAKVDLPEPEGPRMATTVPAATSNEMLLRIGVERPSALATTRRKVMAPVGAIRLKAESRSG